MNKKWIIRRFLVQPEAVDADSGVPVSLYLESSRFLLPVPETKTEKEYSENEVTSDLLASEWTQLYKFIVLRVVIVILKSQRTW